jgi:hypothetical protein
MSELTEILKKLQMDAVEEHVRENFSLNPALTKRAETKIRALIKERVIGGDENVAGKWEADKPLLRNQLRTEQRKALEEL